MFEAASAEGGGTGKGVDREGVGRSGGPTGGGDC